MFLDNFRPPKVSENVIGNDKFTIAGVFRWMVAQENGDRSQNIISDEKIILRLAKPY